MRVEIASAVATVFAAFLRSVGDFRLVGFFKRVRGTRFARYDSLLFSPLSLALGVPTLWLGWAG
jgi:hypothetical protein